MSFFFELDRGEWDQFSAMDIFYSAPDDFRLPVTGGCEKVKDKK